MITARALWAATVAVVLAAAAMAAVALSANLNAQFGPLDDSELLSWLNDDGRFPLSQAWSTLVDGTEFGQFRERGRYRPAFAITKVVETLAFGDNPRLHYLSVTVMYVAACAVAGIVIAWWVTAAAQVRRRVPEMGVAALAGVVGTVLVGTLGSWSGIATRLGASERLAALGFAVMLLGLTALAFNRRGWWWAVALVGSTTAVLAKENFLVLIAAPLVMVVYRVWGLGRSRVELWAAAVAVVPAGLLLWALAPTAAGGSDPYGAGTGASRFTAALESLFVTYRWYWIPSAAVVLAAWAVWTWVIGPSFRRQSLLVLGLIGSGLLLRGYDGWVYGVHGYVYPRYDLIPDLVKATAVAGALALSLAALRRASGRWRTSVSILMLVIASLLCVQSMRAVPAGFARLEEGAVLNAEATSAYQVALDRASDLAVTGGNLSVAIVVTQPIDGVENVKSLSVELRRRQADVRLFLLPDLTDEQALTPLGQSLLVTSEEGSVPLMIRPASELPAGQRVVCAVINGDTTALAQCAPDAVIPVPIRFI